MCGDALMTFGDLNVSDFVVTVNFLLWGIVILEQILVSWEMASNYRP
jgi:hypothetical protein